MASVVPRKNAAGSITSYQVKWRLGGKGDWQTERFDEEEPAKVFKGAVDEAGQHWPPGWVKGKGYIDPEVGDEQQYRFENWARRSIANRTAGEYYKHQRIRNLEMYIFPTFGNCDVRSAEHFSKATIGAWINQMRATKVRRGQQKKTKPKDMSPETLRGLHGLLSSILQEATVTEPPLRDRNPCDLTRLPKDDDHGIEDDSGDEMEFLTPEEVAGLVSAFSRPVDRMLIRLAYGTGMRWGELTALAGRHVRSPARGAFEVRVARAWKRRTASQFYLGPPKTRAGRRTVEITAGLWQELQDYGLAEQHKDALVFPGPNGGQLKYGTFWDRWKTGVKKAKALGLLPDWKFPTFHDLRHSHVAALLSDRHSLTYVQRRLGHESIKTTSDRYGHLLESAHTAALETLDRVMGTPQDARTSLTATGIAAAAVYVAALGQYLVAFDSEDAAEGIAERWVRERGGPVRVDKADQSRAAELLAAVHTGSVRRGWVWEVGPIAYAPDGSEIIADPALAEVRGAWRWDFEDLYTEEPALQEIEEAGRKGPATVRAYGTDEEAVRELFAEARAQMLAGCSLPVR